MRRRGICCGARASPARQRIDTRLPQHKSVRSVPVEEGDHALALLPEITRIRSFDIAERHCLGLHLEVDFGIDVRGIDRRMAKPCAHCIDIHVGEH